MCILMSTLGRARDDVYNKYFVPKSILFLFIILEYAILVGVAKVWVAF